MKTCLVVIFNHKYDNNLPVLRKIYKDKFSLIRFLVPFYEGSDEDVITVYDSSFNFQGYIAKARNQLLVTEADYFFFISDDLILNPILDENNYLNELNIKMGDSMLCGIAPIIQPGWDLSRVYSSLQVISEERFTIWRKELINAEDAYNKLRNICGDGRLKLIEKLKLPCRKPFLKKYGFINYCKFILSNDRMPYPLIGGYSDWFIIPRGDFEIVSKKLGVTSAMGLFVEIAIPTICLLYCTSVRFFNESLKYKDGAMWSAEEVSKIEKQYDNNLCRLMKEFPADKMYLHPIKLSKWTSKNE